MLNEKQKKRKIQSAPIYAYELTVEIDGTVILDKAVEVRRQSELNGIANKNKLEVGQVMTMTAKRVF
jgi:hypothetical protein